MTALFRSMIIALLLASGCRVFDETLLEGDGGMDASVEDAPACALARRPSRPQGEDPRTEDTPFFLALRQIDIDVGEEWRTIGYDLDGLCSLEDAPAVECLPSRSAVPEVDGVGGIDNVVGHQVVPLLQTGFPDLEPYAMSSQEAGLNVLLLSLVGWNGTATDPRVDASIAIGAFGTRRLADGGMPPAAIPDGGLRYPTDGGRDTRFVDIEPPQWDGEDVFFARADSYLGGDTSSPRFRDDNAFVRDGEIVMRLPDREPLDFGGTERGIVLLLTDATLTVRLDEDLEHAEEAVIAGRWSVLDAVEGLEPAGVCAGSRTAEDVLSIFTLTADLRSMPGSAGPTVRCDALSIALRYLDGQRGTLGGVIDVGARPDPCSRDGGL